MMRRVFAVMGGALAFAGAGASCSSFAEAPVPIDGGDDAAPSDAVAPADAAPLMDAGSDVVLSPTGSCPPPTAGSVSPGSWPQSAIYRPAVPEYPFDMDTIGDSIVWIAQTGGASYDGNGPATIYRASKSGPATQVPAVLASGQVGATELVIDGDLVIWATYESGNSVLLSQRIDVDCKATCPNPSLVGPGDATRVRKIVRARPGVLFAQLQSGGIVEIDRPPGGAPQTHAISPTGADPWIAATNDTLYGVAADLPNVTAYGIDSGTTQPSFAPLHASAPYGASRIATDCTSSFLVRATEKPELYAQPLVAGAPVSLMGTVSEAIYDIAADDTYVYLASPNAAGLRYVPIPPLQPAVATLFTGSVYRLTVDSEGVYWGDHLRDSKAAGTIWRAVK